MTQKRSIFEEVGADTPQDVPRTGLIDTDRSAARPGIRIWLGILFLMVASMIIVGGMTRLTDSGLSITEWKPITGAVPPMNEADWVEEFEKYQQIPEFQLQNSNMTLEEFKGIFWWEWGHRQLGRVVGLVWALGFAGFALARKIPNGWTGRLLLLGGLGSLQGAIGWWMVSSGLTGRMVDVASYRLATHLGLAFIILGLITWYMLKLSRSEAQLLQARRSREAKVFSMSTGLMHFAFLQILLGALVAGIDAGRGYIDWPLMGGQVIPDGMMLLEPWWSNFFENPATVQFIHRIAGYLLIIFAIVVWNRARKSGLSAVRSAVNMAVVMLFLQMVLGIITVMNAAPWNIAITHQLGAVLAWVLILRARFAAGYPAGQSVRG